MPAPGDIRSLLVATRRRLRLAEALAGAALAAAVVGGGALALVLLGDRLIDSLGGAGRILVAALLGAGGLGVLAVALRPLGRWRGDDAVAREIGARAGTGDLLLSSVELARILPGLRADSEAARAVSPSLVVALVERAEAESRRLRVSSLVRVAPPRHRLLALAAVAGAWLLAAALVPARFGRGWRALDVRPPAEAPPSAEPIVGDVEIDLAYPAYTHLPPRTIAGTSGEVLALPGTDVTLRARALVPASSATLTVELEHPAAPRPGAPPPSPAPLPVEVKGGQLTARFRVAGAGAYRFTLRSPTGKSAREADAHAIEIEADHPPRVELRAPADDLEVASRRTKVELAYTVEDDYGVGEVDLVWRSADRGGAGAGRVAADGTREHRLVLRPAPAATDKHPAVKEAKPTPPLRTVAGTTQWDLSDLDLQPGVRVAYHVEARDNDDVSGPHVGSSRTLYVRVYSAREKHDELLGAEQSLVEHVVALLGDRLELDHPPPGSAMPPPPDEAQRRTALHVKGATLVAEVQKLLATVAQDTLAPSSLKATIGEVRDRLARLHRADDVELQRLGDPKGATASSPSLRALRELHPKHVAELEADALLLDDLVSKQRLEQLLATADEMARARDRLKELMAEYKKTRSDALRKEIERELRELERRMAELADKASKLRGEVPDEYLNRDAMQEADARKRLDAMRDLLAKGDVDKAMDELNRLSQSIDRMQKELEGNLRGFRNERFSPEEKALADLENRLADLEQEEKQIAQESGEVRDRLKQETERAAKERLDPALKQAQKMADELGRRVGPDNPALGPRAVGASDQESLDRVRRSVEDLRRAIGSGDVDAARELARDAQRGLAELNFSLYGAEQREWVGARQAVRRARGEVQDAQGLAKRLGDELDAATPRPGEAMTPSDRQRLAELAKRQQATARRLEEARRELAKRGQQLGQQGSPSPGQSPQGAPSPSGPPPSALGPADEGLREAGEHMQRAQGKLGEGAPREGAAAAEQAASRLGQLRQQVQRERRPDDGGGGGVRDEVVKIPGAGEAHGPREFRQDLLDAMKRSAPEQYRERVRRYYEELAR